eukprot:11221298-Lingulodinium_polyedra.AAC.1
MSPRPPTRRRMTRGICVANSGKRWTWQLFVLEDRDPQAQRIVMPETITFALCLAVVRPAVIFNL